MGLKDRLDLVIKQSGLSKKEFSERCGISQTQLFAHLRGKQTPSHRFYEGLKKIYPSLDLNWLISNAGVAFQQPLKYFSILEMKERDVKDALTSTYGLSLWTDQQRSERLWDFLEPGVSIYFQKQVVLSIIYEFIFVAISDFRFAGLLREWVPFITEGYVGRPCTNEKGTIQLHLQSPAHMFKLAQEAFMPDNYALIFYYSQVLDFVNYWTINPRYMTLFIEFFGGRSVKYDPFLIDQLNGEFNTGFTEREEDHVRRKLSDPRLLPKEKKAEIAQLMELRNRSLGSQKATK